jgi:hypothetical protein
MAALKCAHLESPYLMGHVEILEGSCHELLKCHDALVSPGCRSRMRSEMEVAVDCR